MSTEELVNIEEENKELELETNIQEIEEDKIRARKNKLKKKREGRPIYKEVEIDFESKIEAKDFLNFIVSELFLDAHLEDRDNIQILVVKNATDKDLAAIKRRKSLSAAEKSIAETADKIAEGAIETAKFAEKVVVPTTKATVKATLGIAKEMVKTTAQVGSSIISSTADSAKQMAEELKEDEDILKAKRTIKKLFKRNAQKKEGIRKKEDIRIVKE